MTTRLAGNGVQVLLLGTATHPGPTLTSLPAAAASLSALQQRLLDQCGVREDRLQTIIDPPDGLAMATAVADAARRADDVLFIYFIGHGLLGPGGELFLAAAGTDQLTPGLAAHQALPVSAIRDAVTACRASSVVVVMDCCFAGREVAGRGRARESRFILPAAHGIYFLGAASDLAVAIDDDGYTAFTGAWIRLLDQGDPRSPAVLSLDNVYDYLFRTLRADGHPLPQRQAGDRSGDLVVAANAAQPVPDEPAAAAPAPIRCPYPGLDAFMVEDADVFCGRDQLVEQLLAGAENAITQRQPLLVVGASGTGKTSLLHAGLLARLGEGAPGMPGSAAWPCLVLAPGQRPLDDLAARLWPDHTDAAARLRDDRAAAGELLGHLLAGQPGRRLVLVVDQLEQLFTLCPDPSERRAYLHTLAALADQPDGGTQALVVLALRADFYAVATGYPQLAEAQRRTQFLVEPMIREQLRTAIEQPAATVGLALDDGLSDLILHELGATEFTNPHPGILPLLSHVLWATWQRRSGVRLTAAGYRATGGIAQAIATTAEDAYTGLDSAGRTAARWLLPRLVRIGDESADTARPAPREPLVHNAPDPAAAEAVVHRFAEARLLTLDTETVRFSHEALLHAWPRLKGWIETDRDWLRTVDQLTTDATSWQRGGHDPSLLYRGSRLAAVQARAAHSGRSNELTAQVVEFLTASHRQQRQARRTRRTAVSVLVVLLLLAATGGAAAVRFQQEAAEQQNAAQSRQLTAIADDLHPTRPGLAKQLWLAAYQLDQAAGAAAAQEAQETPGVFNGTEPAYDLAVSDGGNRLVLSAGNTIVAYRLADRHRQRLESPAGYLAGPVAQSADGRLLAVGFEPREGRDRTGGQLRLWEMDAQLETRPLATLRMTDTQISALAISPNRRLLAAATAAGTIGLWDLSDPAAPERLPPLTGHDDAVDSVTFAPDGAVLASAGVGGTARLWDLNNPSQAVESSRFPIAPMGGSRFAPGPNEGPLRNNPTGYVHRLAFDATGALLAAPVPAGESGQYPQVWDVTEPGSPRTLLTEPERTSSDILGIAFSPSGHTLAVGTGSNIDLWRYTPAQSPVMHLASAPGGRPVGVAFGVPGQPATGPARGSDLLLSATPNGVYVQEAPDLQPPWSRLSLSDRPGGESTLAFSPLDKGTVVFGGSAGTGMWTGVDQAAPQLVAEFPGGNVLGGGPAIAPDGTVFATAERHPTTEHDGTDPAVRIRRLDQPRSDPLATVPGIDNGALDMEFSPDSQLLAIADNEHPTLLKHFQHQPNIKIFDVSDPADPTLIATMPGDARAVAFSPSGDLLTGFTADAVLSWDITDPLRPVTGPVQQMADRGWGGGTFRPDGGLLLVRDDDGLWSWEVSRNELVGEPQLTHQPESTFGPVTFSPDGRTVALGDRAPEPTLALNSVGWVELWDYSDPNSPVFQGGLARGESVYDLTFGPDGRILAVFDGDGVSFWDTDTARSPGHFDAANMEPARVTQRICESIGDPITPDEWERHVPDDIPYNRPCSR